MYCSTHIVLADYLTNPLQGSLFHKFNDIIMVRVVPFILPEETFPYTIKERVVKQIPSKEIPSGTGDPMKETKDMLEDENDRKVHTSTGEPLKNKEMIRDEKGKQLRTYTDILSTGELSNKR